MRTTGCFLAIMFVLLTISCKTAEVNRTTEEHKTIEGRIVTPDGQPAAGAEVHIYLAYSFGYCHFSTVTNPNGEYRCVVHYLPAYSFATMLIIRKAGFRTCVKSPESTIVIYPANNL